MFHIKSKKKIKNIHNQIVYSPVTGQVIRLEDVNDPVFSEHLLGDGLAIIPKDDMLFSPVDGTICTIFPTQHAIGLKTDEGAEILIHIGIDTVMLNGKGFDCQTSINQKVKVGDVLMKIDREEIHKAGYDPTIMVIVTNKEKFKVNMKDDCSLVNNGVPLFEINGVNI